MSRWHWRKRPTVGSASVTITVDTTRLVDALGRAAEATSVIRYRRRIADERRQGRAFIAQLVAQVRQDLGLREDG